MSFSNLLASYRTQSTRRAEARARNSRKLAAGRLEFEPLEAKLLLTTLPTGFNEALITTNDDLTRPTAMEFSPTGQLWVLEQTGRAKVVDFNAGGTSIAGTLTVDPNGERGLLGIAFDLSYDGAGSNADNVYLYYTATTPNSHNRLSRFVVNNAGSSTPTLGTETIIMEIAAEPQGDGSTNHNGGAIHFGLDGNLYIAIGDHNADGGSFQGAAHVSQRLDFQHGKMLRIDVSGDDFPGDPNRNYAIPADNPFIDADSSTFDETWALGLRNPYTFGVQPGTGRIFINDVGEGQWEEINDGVAGSNYGWASEGTPGGFAEGFEASAPSYATVGTYQNPIMAFDHSNTAPSPFGCSIVGGAFYPTGSQFGSAYDGMYFFADFCGNFIRVFDPASPGSLATPDTSTGFATNLTTGSPVDLKIDANGSLYYLSRGGSTNTGEIYRISFDAPTITDQPDNVTVDEGQPAMFSVLAGGGAPLAYQWQRADSATPTNFGDIAGATSADFTLSIAQTSDNGDQFRVVVTNSAASVTSDAAILTVNVVSQSPTITGDPNDQLVNAGDSATFNVVASGTAPLAYQWQRADSATPTNFSNITGATSAGFTLTDAQAVDNGDRFRAVVTNSFGSATSNPATLTVNQIPTATITATSTYSFGDMISFSANATDAEDGALPGSAYTWTVDFAHDAHFHPHVAPSSGVTGGSFVADFIEPDPDQFYRILLTVTDSNDAAFSTFFDVQPIKVNLTLESVPTGVPLTIDGQPVGGPEQSVVGTSRAIQAPATHTLVGTTYDFVSWSDGGAATHTIVTPAADTTFTAQFEISPLAIAIADPSISENGGSTTATVTRDGDTTSELTIALSSSDTSEATVPATVTIPAGQSTSAAFNIDAVDDASVDGPQTVTITASAAGYADVTDTLDVTDDDDADAYAVAETTVLGNITSGDMVATYASDDVYEEITERHSGGRPSNRMSFAEHKWTFDVNSGDPVTFFVEAYRTDSGENDEFLFAYSTNDVDYTDMFTVTKTADDDAYQTHLLTPGIGGTVYVRVIDANRVAGNSSLDTILVDEMFIRSTPGGPVLPSVTITATDADADEEGADPGTFTITRTGDLSGDLTVYYTVGGTATAGPAANQDYNTLGGSVVISSGSPTATVVITPVDDSLAEGSETVTLTLANNAAYLVGGSSSDTVTIADNDTTSTDFLAVSETTVSGKLTSGDLTNTFASDDVYEQITERHSGGNPSNRISFAEHKWTFDVTGGDSVTFFVEAFHTLNTENDDYVFAYSTDDVAYTNMVTVTKTSDDDRAQSYALPSALSGTVYVRVKDADQTQGNGGLDRVFIDRMVIVVDSGSAQAAPAIEPLASVLIPAIMLQIVESDSSDLSLLLDGTHPTRQAAVDSIETIKLMASEPDTNDWLQTLDQALSESEWDDPLCGIEPEDNLDVQLDVTVLRPL